MAKSCGGPWYAFCIESTVRVPWRIKTTCVALFVRRASAPLT
jgi:hypothetical protein